jgi:hypothetical protein
LEEDSIRFMIMMKLMERKEFFGYIGSSENIWSIRSMGMEKYRGKNEPIGMSSKKDSFRGKKWKVQVDRVSTELVTGSFKFSIVLI